MNLEQRTLLEDLHTSRNEEWDVELYKKVLVENFHLTEDEALEVVKEFARYETRKSLANFAE